VADRYDVAARLDEGRPAVDNTQTYVWACHLLGYQNPDLTSHAAQVRDRYGGEDGLDLRVLDRDCAALQSAAAAAEDALRLQRSQLGALTAAWAGDGADGAGTFLQRHCGAAGSAAAAVRAAAETCATLRDGLWQMVDGKVAAAIGIDDRRRSERPAWLAAAHTIGTGVGDRSTATEVVEQQVKPFVDNDIRSDWLTVMRTTTTSVAASYDAATQALTATAVPRFEIPGDLGPRYVEAMQESPTPEAGPATAPAAAPPSPWPSVPADTWPTPADPFGATEPVAAPPVPTTAAAPALGGLPSAAPAMGSPLGGGLPDVGGGLGGLAGRIADAVGGLLSTPTGAGLPDPSELADPVVDEKRDTEHDDTDEPAEDPPEPADGGGGPTPAEAPCDASPDEPTTAAAPPPGVPRPPPQAPPPPPLPAPAPPAAPPPTPAVDTTGAIGSTPCEIAADELPQAGQ
jgi:hypothetical protein